MKINLQLATRRKQVWVSKGNNSKLMGHERVSDTLKEKKIIFRVPTQILDDRIMDKFSFRLFWGPFLSGSEMAPIKIMTIPNKHPKRCSKHSIYFTSFCLPFRNLPWHSNHSSYASVSLSETFRDIYMLALDSLWLQVVLGGVLILRSLPNRSIAYLLWANIKTIFLIFYNWFFIFFTNSEL